MLKEGANDAVTISQSARRIRRTVKQEHLAAVGQSPERRSVQLTPSWANPSLKPSTAVSISSTFVGLTQYLYEDAHINSILRKGLTRRRTTRRKIPMVFLLPASRALNGCR